MSIKLTATYGQPTDPQQFEDHYLSTHVGIAKALPGLRGIDYGKVVGTLDGSPSSWFWIATLLFDDLETLQAAATSEAGQAAVADVAKFASGGVTMTLSEVL